MSAEDVSSDGETPEVMRSTVLLRLQVACASGTPVSLMAAHMSLSSAGRLQSASADGVVVKIHRAPEGALVGSTAAVTYPSGTETTSFISEVTAVADGPDGATLATLALPEQLRAGTRRAAVRVPVPPGMLTATIVQGGKVRGNVMPIDISLTGILIELDALRAQSLEIGERISLRMALDSVELLQDCEIRRQDGRRFGLLFITDGSPPERMAKVMWKLQLRNLPSR